MASGNDSNEFPPGDGGGTQPPHGGGGGDDAPLNTGRPAVASAPGKLVFILILVALFIFVLAKSLFFGAPPPPPEVHHGKEHVAGADQKGGSSDFTITAGSLPSATPPEITANTPPPPPPPPPPAILAPPTPTISASAPTNEALTRRIKSPMIAAGGKAPAQTGGHHRASVANSNDPNAAFAQAVSESDAERVEAKRIADLGSTIGQGKLIHAVLESAIESDLPGPIRAIVSHDIYAEAGRAVMLPKGSRLIGTYNSQIRRGQSRVFIIWQRVIRPDGIDIMIDSPGVDSLGRAGMNGDVDNKVFEQVSAAVMSSVLDIGVAAVGNALFGNQQTTTVDNGSGTTTSESPTAAAMQEAVQNVGTIGASMVNNALNISPTIYIDQGTPINVFVNRDLVFPASVTGSSTFVQ